MSNDNWNKKIQFIPQEDASPITGQYQYKPKHVKDHPHIRSVKWYGRVNRDDISIESRLRAGVRPLMVTLLTFQPQCSATLSPNRRK